MMQPGSSAVFLLTLSGVDEVVARRIRGLGGKVLTFNVDLEQAKKAQAALSDTQG